MELKYALALGIAILNDLSDLVTGWFPLVGEPFDLITGITLLILLRNPMVLVGFAEVAADLFPAISTVSIFPFWTLSVILAMTNKGRKLF